MSSLVGKLGPLPEVDKWDAAHSYEVSGCGIQDCDGKYRHSSTYSWRHGAPVYEGKAGWLLHRGPIEVSLAAALEKGGRLREYGWVISKDGSLPAYGVQTTKAEAVAPASGWQTLHAWKPAPDMVSSTSWVDHLLSSCSLLKEKGNFSMGQGQHKEGETRYTEGISRLEEHEELLETCEELQQLLLALYANRAEARLRLRWWEKSLEDCHWILSWNDGHAKAIVRAAKAYRGMALWHEAVGPLRWLLTDGGQTGNKEAQDLMGQADAVARCKAGKSAMTRIYQDVETLRMRFQRASEDTGQQVEFELRRAGRILCTSLVRLERSIAADRGLLQEAALVLQGTALVNLAADIVHEVQAVGWSVELLSACIWPHTREDELRHVLEVLSSETEHLGAVPDELLVLMGRLTGHRLAVPLQIADCIMEVEGMVYRCLGRWTQHLDGVDANAPACIAAQVLGQLDAHCAKKENADTLTGLLFLECFAGQDQSELHPGLILRSGGAVRQLVLALLRKWADSTHILETLDAKMLGIIWRPLSTKLSCDAYLETEKVVGQPHGKTQDLKRLEWYELRAAPTQDVAHRSLQVEELLPAVLDLLIAHLLVRCKEETAGSRQLVKEWVDEVLDRRFGWGVLLPLMVAPPPIARRVLLLLALLARKLPDDAQFAKRLAGLHAFMPFLTLPWPQVNPAGSHLGETLALGADIRCCAALILRSVAKTDMCLRVVQDNAEVCSMAVLNLLDWAREDNRPDAIAAVVDVFCTMFGHMESESAMWNAIPDHMISNMLESFITSTDMAIRVQLARVLRNMHGAGMELRLREALTDGLPQLEMDADQAELTILEILEMERLESQEVGLDRQQPAAGLGHIVDEEAVRSKRFNAVVDAIFAAYLDPGEKTLPRILVLGRMAAQICDRIGEMGRSCRVVLADISLDHIKCHRLAKCIDPVLLPKAGDVERSIKLASLELFDLVILGEPIGYINVREYAGKLRQFVKRRAKSSENVKEQVQLVCIENEENANEAQLDVEAAGFDVAYHDTSFKELWNLTWKLQYILCVFGLPSEEEDIKKR